MARQPPEHRDSSSRNSAGKKPVEQQADYPTAMRWASLAFELVGSVAVLSIIGYLLDQWLGSAPWGLVIGISLGLVLGFFNLIRQVSKSL